MSKTFMMMLCAAAFGLTGTATKADDRYRERPPVVVSPDLTAPWVVQLGGQVRTSAGYSVQPVNPRAYQPRVYQQGAYQPRIYPGQPGARYARQPAYVVPRQQAAQMRPQRAPLSQQAPVQNAGLQRLPVIRGQIEPQFLPQMVSYQTQHAPGTIVIDTNNRFLYLVMEGGKAKRYGVGVGKPGFEWAGTHTITRKAEWPSWHPPQEMIQREAAKGHYLPVSMEGGPENPLGARAMYLGSTLYRIHGTNAPWTIGSAVSSGCIRMRNEDVTDLYGRVNVGTKVIVM